MCNFSANLARAVRVCFIVFHFLISSGKEYGLNAGRWLRGIIDA